MPSHTFYTGDVLEILEHIPNNSLDLVITSPPYNIGTGKGDSWKVDNWYKDKLPEYEYLTWQQEVLAELIHKLKDGGVLCYNHKVRQKNLRAIHPLNYILQGDLYQEIIWDRGSTHNHAPNYFFPVDERIYIMVKGRKPKTFTNQGYSTVWRFNFDNNTPHPAPFPEELPRRLIRSFAKPGDLVLDPFGGSGTVTTVAEKEGLNSIYIDLSEEYTFMAQKRLEGVLSAQD